MSQENVEVVRRSVDAWNRRDEEEMLALTDPEAEFVNAPKAVEPGTRRGTNELIAVWRTQWEILRGGRIEIDRIYDRGEFTIPSPGTASAGSTDVPQYLNFVVTPSGSGGPAVTVSAAGEDVDGSDDCKGIIHAVRSG